MKKYLLLGFLLLGVTSFATADTYWVKVCNHTKHTIYTTVVYSWAVSHDVRQDFGYNGKKNPLAADTCKERSYGERFAFWGDTHLKLAVIGSGSVDYQFPRESHGDYVWCAKGKVLSNAFMYPNQAKAYHPIEAEGCGYNFGIEININK